MKTTLAIMAAGIGSRYGGGIKQMDPMGPGGEIMMDYSVHDALEAGFDKIVFIIRKDLDEEFRKLIGSRVERVAEVAYAYQELDDLPPGFTVPEGRVKPWGTGQALLAAKDLIHEPFCVINADDYYGKNGYVEIHDLLIKNEKPADGKLPVLMAGFVLKNTLSENGGVTRGLVDIDERGDLTAIHETKNIVKTEAGPAVLTDQGAVLIDPETLVSMNMWGLTPDFLDALEGSFVKFLSEKDEDPLRREFLLPNIIDHFVQRGEAEVRVLRTDDIWFGVTFHEDRENVRAELQKLTDAGVYRTPLFER